MQAGASEEWRKYWTLAVAAALGNSLTVLPLYSLGPFMSSLQDEFGWTRAQVSLGATVSTSLGAVLGVGVGLLMDRWGPRPIGIAGVAMVCSAYALLGTTSAAITHWLSLWVLIGIGAACIKPTVWTSAVSSRFDRSRGVAIAVTISGSGVAATVIPPLATWFITNDGWRSAFAGVGFVWAVAVLPFLILFFRGSQDRQKKGAPAGAGYAGDQLPGLSVAEGLRSPAFAKLGFAGMMFAFTLTGLIVHFVPVLRDRGVDSMTAASIAGLLGVSSIVGRLGAGFLIDRFRADRVAVGAFLLPIAAVGLLLVDGGLPLMVVAAIVVGLSLGSELDVIIYLTTRHLGLKRLGVLFGSMLLMLSLGSALGPVTAGLVFDQFGSYLYFLLAMIPLCALGAVIISTLGPYPTFAASTEPKAA
ncbi:MAG: MFS transporter [Hyphomonadaceae bacterium]|nr:MFS transporter [Hyphomonadaceae bacterium]